MWLQLGLQLALPAGLIFLQWRARPASRLKWLTDTLVGLLVLLFAVVTARWDLTSYYLRILVLLLFALVSYLALRRVPPPAARPSSLQRLRANAGNVLLIAVFGWLNAGALIGYGYPGEAVTLAYPLRDGVYYVGGGGSSRWINNHHVFPPQDYALDIVRLNALGNRGWFGDPADLERYAIFGDPIYSPCSGTVAGVANDRQDLIPPNSDPANPAGNYVLIACQDVEILLAHMQQSSVTVAAGDEVKVGDFLGAVGNSGNTSQPHLHIHAERGGSEGRILNGQGVPIVFGDRFLVRNSLFSGQGTAEVLD